MDAAVPTAEAQRPPSAEPIEVRYVPRPGLLKLSIVNAIFNVLTLSIYRFWARTKVRRHIWSCVRINGEPLEYTGTGLELFLGALVVFALFGLPIVLVYAALVIMYGPEHWSIFALQGGVLLVILVLYGMAVYRARRYRLSRTLWRGIRGTLIGSSWAYTLRHFGATLLRMITLGWATPAMNLMLESRITNEMRFGDRPFRFAGSTAPLYRKFALCWFLTLLILLPIVGIYFAVVFGGLEQYLGPFSEPDTTPSPETVGFIVLAVFGGIILYGILSAILWASYTVREMNVFASYTHFDHANFQLAATTPSLIWLWLGNLLLVIFTLGIAEPYAVQRAVRYACDRLTVLGTVDIGSIRQSQAALDKRGEGLVDAFDIDGF